MKFLFNDDSFSFETLRATGFAVDGGVDLSDVIVTTNKIPEGDENAWRVEWTKTADRIYQLGMKSYQKGHKVSAREAFFRASNYYRLSEFYLRVDAFNDPNMLPLSRLSRETFIKGAQLLPTPFEQVEVPYEDTSLPAYFFSVDDSGSRRPTIIYNNGFDSTKEEAYFVIVTAALRRGYNVLAFDGPGAGSVIRENHIFYRNDWEAVITPVLDYVISRVDVDAEKITLFGYSLGGYQVARASAFDKRAAAIILNNGMHDFLECNIIGLPQYLKDWYNEGKDEEFNIIVETLMAKNTGLRWALNNGKWTYNTKTVSEYLRKIEDHKLEGLAHNITAAALILEAESDKFLQGQSEKLQQWMTSSNTTLVKMTDAEGAGEHCSEGAMLRLQQVMFDWLDELLSNNP